MIRKFQNYTTDEMRESGLTFGEKVYIANDVIIHNPHNVIIGNNVRIDTQCVIIAGKNHKIKIGDNVHISAGCYFYGNSGNITIGDSCCTSGRCILYTANDDYTEGYMANSVIDDKYKRVTTGDIELKKHSLIGCNTVILPGVRLAYATSVGAHSLVTKSTERFDVVAGCPAKFIKKRKNVNLLDLGLLVLADAKNYKATEQSINSFRKFHTGKVVVVNTQHTDEIRSLASDNVVVVDPPQKLPYPLFSINEINGLVDYMLEGVFKPSLQLDTEFFVFGEPDCLFFKETNIDDINPYVDIMPPTPYDNEGALFWAFTHFFLGYGHTQEERFDRIRTLFQKFVPICEKYGLDWDAAASLDLRFIFTCGSIIKTKRIQELYTKHADDIRGLMLDICTEVYNNKPEPEIDPKYTSLFSFDLMMAILLGLYMFRWQIKPNYRNCDQRNFPDEAALQEFLNNNPNTEFIHSIKLHYNIKNELVCNTNINQKLDTLNV